MTRVEEISYFNIFSKQTPHTDEMKVQCLEVMLLERGLNQGSLAEAKQVLLPLPGLGHLMG